MVVYRYGTYASSISNHDFVAVRRFYIYGVCLSVFSVIHYVLLHGLAIQLNLDLDICTVHIGAGINKYGYFHCQLNKTILHVSFSNPLFDG